jgi:radical SAM superfamily enzyme YgiQ (UPF0313 family)
VSDTAKKIKRRFDVTTIIGGPHPTYFSELITKEGVDIIAKGEADFAIAEVADKIENGKDITSVKNIWIKKEGRVYKNELDNLLADLDKLPFPDRDLYVKGAEFNSTGFVAGRGCPYDCSYCFNHISKEMYKGKGKYVRMRSFQNIIAEIESVKKRHNLKKVIFNDDIFILNREWLNKFTKQYLKKIKMPYKCFVRANLVDEELVKLLKKGLCETVYFGIESGDEELRKSVLNKNVSDEQLIKTGKLFHKYGITIGTFNMMGIPSETVEQALKTIRINRIIKTDFPRIMLLQPYPKTKVSEFAVEKGYMDELNPDEFGKSFLKKSLITQENISRLINIQRMSYFGIRSKLMEPLIKQLSKLPENFLFELLFLFSLSLINAKETKQNLFITALKGLKVVKQAF